MVDEYKKFIGVLILVIAAAVSVFVMKTYYPEFYDQTIQLTLAGDIDGLGDYISSFGYGAFAVSIGLLIFCNVFGIDDPLSYSERSSFWSDSGTGDLLAGGSLGNRAEFSYRAYLLQAGSEKFHREAAYA